LVTNIYYSNEYIDDVFVYLYITKYRYSILYYRPEKKDVWLINEDNEIIRFI